LWHRRKEKEREGISSLTTNKQMKKNRERKKNEANEKGDADVSKRRTTLKRNIVKTKKVGIIFSLFLTHRTDDNRIYILCVIVLVYHEKS
jgi:hypothetical protein